jgi:hypothetical protein
MKLFLQIVVAVIFHPVAVILMWLNLASRSDLKRVPTIIWAIVGIVWGIGPILYILVGEGALW